MAQAYDAEGMDEPAVFELFFRELLPERNYLVAAGLADVLDALAHLRFSDDDLAYLRGLDRFSPKFLDRLRQFRFTGDVYAMPEGTPVFANEPVVQVVAPILEAQLIETLVLNQVHLQTVAASKAARLVAAAGGRTVVDFGSRRAHGADAALKVARTSYLVGAAGTSLVLAGKRYGIPVFGTMAHSYIQAHDDEGIAFEVFARLYPQATLLVDTYDTLQGVQRVIDLSRRLSERIRPGAIRLDSGELGELARQARQMLDAVGLNSIRIFASSELDEYAIAALVAQGAPIDGFGVGTKLAVADGAPHIDLVYKLVEYAGQPRIKLSSQKVLYPGRKQVFRFVEQGRMVRDVIARHDETLDGELRGSELRGSEPLLQPVMRAGQRLPAGQVSLEETRSYARRELTERLPEAVQSLAAADPPYPVTFSAALQHDLAALRRTAPA